MEGFKIRIKKGKKKQTKNLALEWPALTAWNLPAMPNF